MTALSGAAYLGAAVIGVTLHTAGIGWRDWQLWVVMVCYGLAVAVGEGR
jgi:hypothetical protein